MGGQATTTAETLELMVLNQIAIRATLEKRSLWVSQRGSLHINENVMAALATLDVHSEAISSEIERPRGERSRS